jgi:hypothetical protein
MNFLRFSLLLAWIVPYSNAGSLGDRLAQKSCATVEHALRLTNVTTCTCTGNLAPGSGITATVGCKLINPVCLVPPYICGKSTVDASFNAKLLKGTPTLDASVTACFYIDSGLPAGLTALGIPNSLCISAKPSTTSLQLASCAVKLGGTQCKSCTVCSSGVAVQFDCSNVNLAGTLLPSVVVPGPVVNTCLSLALVPAGKGDKKLL